MLEFSDKTVDLISYKQLWAKNIRPTVVYLHNPFCKTETNCGYCMHKGCPKNNHTEQEVQQFYFEYMPKLFKEYDDILKDQNIQMVDFGGGTPNYLSAEDFDKYMSLLPMYLKNAPSKIIELHPALITENFIRVLSKYKFTTVIFCFQTFDEKILRTQGRLIPNFENAFNCMRLARTSGINVAVDLITYWTTENGWEDVLRDDLSRLTDFKPDEITISVLYQNKYNRDDFNGVGVYRKIRSAVDRYFPGYDNPENTLNANFNVAATRIYRSLKSKAFDDFQIYINSLSDMPWEHEQGYSTFGMGTYKNGDKAAYSMMGPDFLFYEEFKGFDERPEIHQHKKWNFWEAAKETIRFYEELYGGENPPVGENLVLQNVCLSKNLGIEQFDHFQQGNKTKHTWLPRQSLSDKSEIEKNFENKFSAVVDKIDKNVEIVYNF